MADELAKMEFTRDIEGKELLLKDGKFQVMMEWEKPYMQACIKALQPKGDVLEVGFGCGYASTYIQEYKPKSHTIIEYHPVVAARAREWAKDYENVVIIESTWQEALSKLGTFDALFFDDYPLESEQQMTEKKNQASEGHEALQKGKAVIDEAYRTIPALKTMRYAEKDIEEFFKLLSTEKQTCKPKELVRFFHDMKKDGHLTKDQLDFSLQRLVENKLISSTDLIGENVSEEELFQHQGDRLFTFIDLCIQHHMNPEAVFSCYLEDPTSKLFDQKFVDHIITNPFLDYHEEWIPIEVPKHCKYYKGDQALVIKIQKSPQQSSL